MKISKYFIERPVLSAVCSLLIALCGLVSIANLPVESIPNIAPPTIEVTAAYPGANAEIVEKSVTTPLERQINSIQGLDYLLSNSSSDGVSNIRAVFNSNTDPSVNKVNVLNSVQTATAELPSKVAEQGVRVKESDLSYLQVYNLEINDQMYDRNFLSGFYDSVLSDSLSNLKGVGQIVLLGGSKPAYRLWLDPQKLKKYSLTAADVIQALQAQNQVVEGGLIGAPPFIREVNSTVPLLINGNLEGAQELNRLVVKTASDSSSHRDFSSENGIVYLEDVGRVQYSSETLGEQSIDSKHGNPSLSFGIIKQPGFNTVNTSRRINDYISHVSLDLPIGINLVKVFDQANYVNSALAEAQRTLRAAFILVVLVVFLFLQDWRSTLIPLIALPVSLLGATALTRLFSGSVDSLTLIGFGLATGLIVDDAIIVVEAISAKIDLGASPKKASLEAMDELESPIITTAIALIAVFLPTLFVAGPTGIIFNGIAITIIFCILVSTFNAITGKPLQASILLKKEKSMFSRSKSFKICALIGFIYGLLSGELISIVVYTFLGGLLGWNQKLVFGFVNYLLSRISAAYEKSLDVVIKSCAQMVSVILFGFLLVFLFIGFYPKSFVPEQDQGYGLGTIQLSGDASLQATMEIANKAQKIIAEEPEVLDGALIGGTGFYGASPNQGIIAFGLKPFSQRLNPSQSASAVLESLNGKFKTITDAQVVAVPPPAVPGFSVQGGIHSFLVDESNNGYSFKSLLGMAQSFVEANSNYNFSSITTPASLNSAALLLKPDRQKLAALDVDYEAAMTEISALYGGRFSGGTYENGRYRQIYVQADSAKDSFIDSLDNVYLSSRKGNLIPMSELIDVEVVDSPNFINHFNLRRAIPVQALTSSSLSTGQAIDQLRLSFKELGLPKVSQDWSGLARSEIQARWIVLSTLVAGLVMAYFILCTQFNSFIDPIVLISSLPLAFLGSFLFLAINQLDLNLFAEFAFLAMVSLQFKNGILIIALANGYRQKGVELVAAIQQAALRRLRPILMTSFAALAGFFPLMSAVGAGALAQRSIGTVLFGGYLVASATSLFVVPTIYVAMKRRFLIA